MANLLMECRIDPDLSKMYVFCMSVSTGLHAEAGRDCPFDRIALLE